MSKKQIEQGAITPAMLVAAKSGLVGAVSAMEKAQGLIAAGNKMAEDTAGTVNGAAIEAHKAGMAFSMLNYAVKVKTDSEGKKRTVIGILKQSDAGYLSVNADNEKALVSLIVAGMSKERQDALSFPKGQKLTAEQEQVKRAAQNVRDVTKSRFVKALFELSGSAKDKAAMAKQEKADAAAKDKPAKKADPVATLLKALSSFIKTGTESEKPSKAMLALLPKAQAFAAQLTKDGFKIEIAE